MDVDLKITGDRLFACFDWCLENFKTNRFYVLDSTLEQKQKVNNKNFCCYGECDYEFFLDSQTRNYVTFTAKSRAIVSCIYHLTFRFDPRDDDKALLFKLMWG